MVHNKRGRSRQPVSSGRREGQEIRCEVGDNEENILLGNSEEESNLEPSEITSEFDTIRGTK